jgi:hypothetical protein
MNRYLVGLAGLAMAGFAVASDDNEINLLQSGDILTIYIDQVGYGNKIGGDDFSVTSSAMPITGSGLTFDIDQLGNSNLLYGVVVSNNSTYNMEWTGDSNSWDWNLGYVGSTDTTTMDVKILGDYNVMDLDQGQVASSERLDFDLNILGTSNTFDVDIETDDVIWNWDITGDSNDLVSLQNDGFYQEQTVIFDGDNADIDINQLSGSCAVGISTCKGIITLDITSDNATIQINQKDTSNDS